MRTVSRTAVGLAVAALGCVELRYADPVTDRPEAADVRDASDVDVPVDVPAVRDVPDVPGALDAPDATVARDAPDAPDVRDVPDAPDVRDVPDAPDVPVMIDVPDVPRDVPRDVPMDFVPTAVTLQSATASYSQVAYEVTRAIDGSTGGGQGWGIAPVDGGAVGPQSAVFEFAAPTPPSSNGTRVQVTLVNSRELFRLVSFRLALTTASRDLFADGMISGGNLGADALWTTPFTVASATATGGVTLSSTAGSFLASTMTVLTTYTILLDTPASQLTGLRLDAIPNAAIPGGGPGTASAPSTGNFILSEIQVSVSRRP